MSASKAKDVEGSPSLLGLREGESEKSDDEDEGGEGDEEMKRTRRMRRGD